MKIYYGTSASEDRRSGTFDESMNDTKELEEIGVFVGEAI